MDNADRPLDPPLAGAYGAARALAPPGAPVTLLYINRRQMELVSGTERTPHAVARLETGPDAIAEAIFRHERPTPGEIETAIATVEDELAPVARSVAPGSMLVALGEPIEGLLAQVPMLEAGAAPIARESIEAVYQRLAAISLGAAPSRDETVAGPAATATVIVLRECMHHLGFETLTLIT